MPCIQGKKILYTTIKPGYDILACCAYVNVTDANVGTFCYFSKEFDRIMTLQWQAFHHCLVIICKSCTQAHGKASKNH